MEEQQQSLELVSIFCPALLDITACLSRGLTMGIVADILGLRGPL